MQYHSERARYEHIGRLMRLHGRSNCARKTRRTPDSERPNGWMRSTLRRMREGCKRARQAWGFKAATLQLAEAARREWVQDWAAAVRKHRARVNSDRRKALRKRRSWLSTAGAASPRCFRRRRARCSGSPMLPRECTCGHGCSRWLTESWSVWVETAAAFLAMVC